MENQSGKAMKSLLVIMCGCLMLACAEQGQSYGDKSPGFKSAAGAAGAGSNAGGPVEVEGLHQNLSGPIYRVPSNVKGGLPANAYQSQMIAICGASQFGTDEIFAYTYKEENLTMIESPHWRIEVHHYGESFGSNRYFVVYAAINSPGAQGTVAWAYELPSGTPASARVEFYSDTTPLVNIAECLVKNQLGSMQLK
jgi:hypothetical protein